MAAAAAEVAALVDRLDVLVNNAGIGGARTAPLDTGADDSRACHEVNLCGPVRVTRAFLPLLEAAALPRTIRGVPSRVTASSLTRSGDMPDQAICRMTVASS